MTTRFLPLLGAAALVASCATATAPAPAGSASPAATTAPSTAASTPASTTPSGEPAAETPDADGCEHLAQGPVVAVKANLDTMNRERATIGADHKRYDVTLEAKDGKYEGYVLFNSDEAGDFHFFLGKDVPFTLVQDGKTVAFESSAKTSTACGDIKGAYVAELGVGPVEVRFGATAETLVPVVIIHGGEGHEHAE